MTVRSEPGALDPTAAATEAREAAALTEYVRPRYVEDQLLHWQDLDSEQRYRLAARYGHNLRRHGWGILNGLDAKRDPKTPTLYVEPGLAIDGFGREILLSESYRVPDAWFDQYGGETFDLWIHYWAHRRSNPLHGNEDIAPSRWAESPLIFPVAVSSDAAQVDPKDPERFPPAPSDVVIEQGYGNQERWWPIYLGRVRRVAQAPMSANLRVKRAYCAATGERIRSAAEAVELRWHGGENEDPGVLLRVDDKFLLALGPDNINHVNGHLRCGDKSVARDRVLVVSADADRCDRSIRMVTSEPAPTVARPWQIYRATVNPTEEEVAFGVGPSAPVSQLRVEIPGKGSETFPATKQFAIGRNIRPSKERRSRPVFAPILRVSPDGDVRINGRVVVDGAIVESIIEPNPQDPRYPLELVKAWLSSPAAAAAAEKMRARSHLRLRISEFRVSKLGSSNNGAGVSFNAALENQGLHVVRDMCLFASFSVNNVAVHQCSVGPNAPGVTLEPKEKRSPIPVEIDFASPDDRPIRFVRLKLVGAGIGQLDTPVLAFAHKSKAFGLARLYSRLAY